MVIRACSQIYPPFSACSTKKGLNDIIFSAHHLNPVSLCTSWLKSSLPKALPSTPWRAGVSPLVGSRRLEAER